MTVWRKALLGLVAASFALAAHHPAVLAAPDIPAVVVGSRAPWLEQHAGQELARYLSAATGEHIVLTSDKEALPSASAILVGQPQTNLCIAERVRAGGFAVPRDLGDEGFVIDSISCDGRQFLVISAAASQGVLYGVHHYLEEFCGFGFFQDGDYIPKLDTLPMKGIRAVERPRFEWRRAPVWLGPTRWSVKKYQGTFWQEEDWQHQLDWMAKRKLNLTAGIHTYPGSDAAGDVYYGAFPEIGPRPYPDAAPDPKTEGFAAGMCFWPPEYRQQRMLDYLHYGRQRGIKFIYGLDVYEVPARFIAAHPEYRYFGADRIHPDEPKIFQVSDRFLRYIIDTFGTDHFYQTNPFVEAAPGASPEETLHLKVAAASRNLEGYMRIDPKAVWVYDTWDWGFEPGGPGAGNVWTLANAKEFLDSFSKDHFYIYDTNADFPYSGPLRPLPSTNLYELHNYFYGKNWAFGVLLGSSGSDEPQGDLTLLMERLRNIAHDPRARNCDGVYMIPEMTGANGIYFHLVSLLAWNPDKFADVDEYLRYYALRRYGKASWPNMVESLRLFVAAKYSGDLSDNGFALPSAYQDLGRFPQNVQRRELGRFKKRIPMLRRAVEFALREAHRQRGNPLYTYDIVQMTEAYLAELCNYQLGRLVMALQVADAATAQEVLALDPMRYLEGLEEIVATRPELSLAKTLEEVKRVPGTNPAVDLGVRRDVITWDYALNDQYEQIRDYYVPRMQAYLDAISKKLFGAAPPETGRTYAYGGRDIAGVPFSVDDPLIAKAFSEIAERFRGLPLVVTPEMRENWRQDSVAVCRRVFARFEAE